MRSNLASAVWSARSGARARVEDAGGHIKRSKISIGQYDFISLFFETEGNMIGLHSRQ